MCRQRYLYLHYVPYTLNRWNKITQEKPCYNWYSLSLPAFSLLSFQLNIPSQRYLPKQPYARPRNGRAINYITAFSQVRKSRSSRSGPDQSSRGQQEAQHRALSRALRTFNYRPQSSINFVFPRSPGRLCRRAFLPSGVVTALHRFIPAVTFCANPSVIKTARSLHAW